MPVCQSCDRSYEVSFLRLDSGTCSSCKPPFWSFQLTGSGSPWTARQVWQINLVVHVIYLFLSSIILCPEAAVGALYSLAASAYYIFRMILGETRGYPKLTRRQELVVLLWPAWGPVLAVLTVAALGQFYEAAGVMTYLEGR